MTPLAGLSSKIILFIEWHLEIFILSDLAQSHIWLVDSKSIFTAKTQDFKGLYTT